MAVKLRLTRVGSKKNPIYRVVAADTRSPRDGKFLEILGRYNPQTEPSLIELDEAKVRDWLARVKGGNAFRGVTGDIRFRADGDPERSGFVMTRVQNGALVPQEEAR